MTIAIAENHNNTNMVTLNSTQPRFRVSVTFFLCTYSYFIFFSLERKEAKVQDSAIPTRSLKKPVFQAR